VIICIILYGAHQNRKIISINKNFKHESKQLRNLTAMLLSASFSHLVLTLPSLYLFIPHVLHYFGYYSDNHMAQQSNSQYIWWVIVTCLIYLDQSVNFLFYCFSAKLVRIEFFKMVKCKNRFSVNNEMIYMQGRKHSFRSRNGSESAFLDDRKHTVTSKLSCDNGNGINLEKYPLRGSSRSFKSTSFN